ncbi:MAG: sensor histidine kinase [Planctomycetota bacterium]|jgi:signal transduction histidine kinase
MTFAIGLLIAAGALGWLSAVLLGFEGERRETAARERLHADLRLAVWRIDSLMAPVLAEEAARPPDQYRSFYPLVRSYDVKGGENEPNQVLVPSPILNPSNAWAVLNFEIDEKGDFSSPQVPPKHLVTRALANGVPPEQLDGQGGRLEALSGSIDTVNLKARLGDALASGADDATTKWFLFNDPPQILLPPMQGKQQKRTPNPQAQSVEDYNARARAVNRMADQRFQQQMANTIQTVTPSPVEVSHLVPLWVETEESPVPSLILARRVRMDGKESTQGVLVDWPVLKAMAEKEVEDLFPNAELKPCPEGPPLDPDRTLAVLPAELAPGVLPEPVPEPLFTPLRVGIASLWAAFLVGSVVLGAGLRSLLALNRRRLDFVSAVTHELRTPLTTFRMYAEMLKEGMVPEEKREEYFGTLHEESQRLSHLVQNVLDYSRIESNRAALKRERAPLGVQLERTLSDLEERCKAGGLPFAMESAVPLETEVLLDPSALGQILYNLVDNACKYGEGEVKLLIASAVDRLRFTVADGGKGLEGAEREKIFSPFTRGKSAEGKGAGVGLGLALCRRWARELGGTGGFRRGRGRGSRWSCRGPEFASVDRRPHARRSPRQSSSGGGGCVRRPWSVVGGRWSVHGSFPIAQPSVLGQEYRSLTVAARMVVSSGSPPWLTCPYAAPPTTRNQEPETRNSVLLACP